MRGWGFVRLGMEEFIEQRLVIEGGGNKGKPHGKDIFGRKLADKCAGARQGAKRRE